MSSPGKRSPSGLVFALAVGLIVAVGVSLRVGDLRAVEEEGVGLDPDVHEYLTIARQMKHFYWPTYREPLHPALIRVATCVVGSNQRAPRLVSFVFSNVLVLVTAVVGRRLFGRWPALVGAAFVAVHPYYLYASVVGMRLEVYSVLLLTFIWLAAEEQAGKPGLRLVLAGAVGGLLCLSRMTSFVLVLPALVWFVVARREVALRERLVAGVTALLLMVLMVAPYLYLCHRYLGDGLVWINRHATWWHYRELQEKEVSAGPEGGPGLEARERPSAQAPSGGRVTVGEFLIRDRSLAELFVQMFRGYGEVFGVLTRIFGTETLYALTVLVGWLGFVGVARSLWQGLRLPVMVVVLSLLPVSFVVPLGANPRLYLHVLPMWVLWSAWGLAWPAEALWPAGEERAKGT